MHCSPDGRFVYGSNRLKDAEGTIVIFKVDENSGALTLVNHVGSGGETPRNFVLHPTGKWMLVANQGSCSVVVFRVDTDTGDLTQTNARLDDSHSPLCLQFVPGEPAHLL